MKIREEDIIASIVKRMRDKRSGAVSSVVNNLDNTYTLSVKNTFDIRVGFIITVLSNNYSVTAVVSNTSITVQSTTDLTAATSWKATTPIFMYGNPIDRSTENDKVPNQDYNYPAIIMFPIKSGSGTNNYEEEVNKTPSFQLFFMTICPFQDKTISDIHAGALADMQDLYEEFMFMARTEPGIEIMKSTYRFTQWEKWSVVAISGVDGSFRTIFNAPLTGWEINIDIPIQRTLNPVCKTDWRFQSK